MKKENLKVFHGLVNYGTQAGILAKDLREFGVCARSYTKADLYYRQTDYHFKPRKTSFGKLFYYKFWYQLVKISCFFRYNIFHFYYGTTLFNKQKDLPFYRFFGKKVIMHYLGGDIQLYQTVIERYKLPLNHRFHAQASEHDRSIQQRINYEEQFINKQIVCSPAYSEFAPNAIFIPLAINIKKFRYHKIKNKNTIRIIHAPTDKVFKGTSIIEDGITKLINEGLPIEYKRLEKLSHNELLEEYQNCDIFIDQISIGWFGTAALEAMALGRPTCAFIDPLYFSYISKEYKPPIVNINADNITNKLRKLVYNFDLRKKISISGRKFIEDFHDSKIITHKLIKIYKNL